jgi:hypothetical protein
MFDFSQIKPCVPYEFSDEVKQKIAVSGKSSIPVWVNGVVPGIVWSDNEGTISISIENADLRSPGYDTELLANAVIFVVTYRGAP